MEIDLFLVFSYSYNHILTGNTIYMNVNITTWMENTRKHFFLCGVKLLPFEVRKHEDIQQDRRQKSLK